MDTETQLRHWLGRLEAAPVSLFPSVCGQFMCWLAEHPVLGPEIRRLGRDESFEKHLADLEQCARSDGAPKAIFYSTSSPTTFVRMCVQTLLALGRFGEGADAKLATNFVLMSCFSLTGEDVKWPTPQVASITLARVAGGRVAEFAAEVCSERAGFVVQLRRYVERSTRFRRARLRDIAAGAFEGRSSAELRLQVDVFEFLFDQNVDFTLDENTGGGRPDLVLRGSRGNRWVVDVKYLSDSTDVAKEVADGVSQVGRYCRDLQEAEGYLVVVANHPSIIRVAVEPVDGFFPVPAGGPVVQVTFCDIFARPSASKEGRAPEVVLPLMRIQPRPA